MKSPDAPPSGGLVMTVLVPRFFVCSKFFLFLLITKAGPVLWVARALARITNSLGGKSWFKLT